MRRFEREGVDYCEFHDQETRKLKISDELYQRLSAGYFKSDPAFCGVVSAFDGPNGTSWIFEIDEHGFFQSVTAITGYEAAPGFMIRPRPNVKLE